MTEIKLKKRDSSLESLLHSEHIVNIEKLLVGGDGLARIQVQDQSVVVFIQNSAPQDQLLIKITEVQKNFMKGLILKIMTPGPSRREPPCIYAFDCGGCNWQHVSETEQVYQKELILKDLFAKFLPNQNFNLLPTVTSEKKFGYRNRIQLKHKNLDLGYFKKNSHQLINIDDCLISEDVLRTELKTLKQKLKPTSELKKYELRINQKNAVEHYEIGDHGEDLAFSQVNNGINDLLTASVCHLVEVLSKDHQDITMTELYAGAGNFTFPLVDKVPALKIQAVELNSVLTRFAVEKIKTLKLSKKITFFTTKCETFANNFSLSKNIVLLDPPRSGCHPDLIERLSENSSEHIIYISCHPTFLVRDLDRLLKKNPAYKVKSLQIFDMFPQTDHFETVCYLAKS